MVGKGSVSSKLKSEEVIDLVISGLAPIFKESKSALLIIPDSTRTLPLPLIFPVINQLAIQQKCTIDYLIALGTHPPLSINEIQQLLGIPDYGDFQRKGGPRIFNHDWQNKTSLGCIGKITSDEVSEITEGLLQIEIPVTINKLVDAYEQIVICGPVFPHEVAGFSGGEKYFFPGIAGEEIINITHWVGALSTSMDTIGKIDTPVRKILHRASLFIKKPITNMAFCIKKKEVFGLYIGGMKETWSEAAMFSSQLNIVYVSKMYQSVLSQPLDLYNELWTAAKAMYKLEPIVSDGGELIIYAPYLNEISLTHGNTIEKVGYHVRDYFTKQWDIYCNFPWAVLAHSTHLKGKGVYENGVEVPRIQVKLATGIPKELCQKINLDYIDPNSISLSDWKNNHDRLIVKNAGEILYRTQ